MPGSGKTDKNTGTIEMMLLLERSPPAFSKMSPRYSAADRKSGPGKKKLLAGVFCNVPGEDG